MDPFDDLYARVSQGHLATLKPFDIGDGTGQFPAERTIAIMLADLAHLDGLPLEVSEWVDQPYRWQHLLDDFRRLRELIG